MYQVPKDESAAFPKVQMSVEEINFHFSNKGLLF